MMENENILYLNNKVVKLFRRLLSRYRFCLRFMADLTSEEAYEKVFREMDAYFGKKNLIPGMQDALTKKDVAHTRFLLAEGLQRMKVCLPRMAEEITQLLLPRRRGKWVWRESRCEGRIGSGIMGTEGDETYGKGHYLYRMGGLSIARLTQLEEWRRCLQSLSRLLFVSPVESPMAGRATRGIPVQDPCPSILRKIEHVRNTRVNEIAHAIAAQALGVRLVQPARKNKNADGKDVWHGEYERIPGRGPVSFVVLENLSAYRMNIDHPREENTTLMRWAHRKIADKVVQMLQEVYGIPVLFTHAAYTSKFDCMTSAPGFRSDIMTQSRLRLMEKKGEDRLCGVQCYEHVWNRLPQDVKLYMPNPKNGGEYFISCVPGGEPVVRNADSNAAVNIAWRALASPQALHLLHKIRLEKGTKGIKLRQNSKREMAVDKKTLEILQGIEQEKGSFLAFYGEKTVSPPMVTLEGVPLCHGKDMWGRLKQNRWLLCHRLNLRILRKVGLPCPELEKLLKEEEDDIPR